MGAWLLCALGVLVVVLRIALYPWAVSDPVHSRWLTIEALVEDGTFAVGFRVEDENGGYRDVGRATTLPTVDVMLDPESKTFYSSKPPFLQVLYAPLVKLLAMLTGASGDVALQRASLMRLLLLLVHALPFALGLAWLTRWWLRTEDVPVALFLVAVAGCATFVTTFSNALSNHMPAAFATLIAVIGLVRVVVRGERSFVWFLLAGLGAGFAAAFEYPAGTLVVAVLVLLARVDGRRALLFAAPAALLPLLLSHALDYAVFGEPLFFLARDKAWFHYQGSYWEHPRGLDLGERAFVPYVAHFLVGHHGALWLTPLWLVSVVAALRSLVRGRSTATRRVVVVAVPLLVLLPGLVHEVVSGSYRVALLLLVPLVIVPLLWPREDDEGGEGEMRRLLLATSLPSLAFYLGWTENYGGLTSGPRWLLWLTPLWLVTLPYAFRSLLATRRGRLLAAGLLILSLYSAFAAGANPYRHPWTFRLYEHLVLQPSIR